MSVSMKEAKGAPSPKVDLLTRRALRLANRLFLELREHLQAWREARKRCQVGDEPSLAQDLALELSSLGWGASALAFAGSSAGGSSSGGGVRNTGPPSPAPASPTQARTTRSVGFGIFMASFLGWIATVLPATGFAMAMTKIACMGQLENVLDTVAADWRELI